MLIEKRMKEMGVQSMSAFIIKMEVDGYCVKLDLKNIKEMIYFLKMCSRKNNHFSY